jgi:ATP-dependent protease ClpP protease subunit
MATPFDKMPEMPSWLKDSFSNKLVRVGLGLLIAFGLAFVVRRMLQKREEKRQALAAEQAPEVLTAQRAQPMASPPPALESSPDRELQAEEAVAPAMNEPTPPPAPAPDQESRAQKYPLLAAPHIHLSGPVDHAMYSSFREQLQSAPKDGTLVIAISTLGGDPEVARLMGDEVRLLREYNDREILFLGKVAVYSAGATFMAAFPVDKRFLTKGTRIMIHERIMTSTINLSGPLKSLTATLRAKLHEIEHSVKIEEEGFRDLVAGSKIGFDEVCKRAPENWYIHAEEAREMGLVLDVI